MPLRKDLMHAPGPRDISGAPSHVLHDPAANGYFHLGALEFEILARWHMGAPAVIAESITKETTYSATPEDVAALEQQLRQGGLLRLSARDVLDLETKAQAARPNVLARLSNALLFLRLPLLRPQVFLDRTAILVAPFFTRAFWGLLILLFIAALYLIGRQWDGFVASLSTMVTFYGAFSVAVALAIAKSMHELAHGYAARRYGADVPVMGVAFIIFWPLLYTETSNAWTVASRKHRIVIAAAGVAAEFALAVTCLVLWPFMEPGPLRDAAGFTATTLILLSLAFNANPLMRFDGYFILSELSGIDNMQPRAFELLKWYLRKAIAGVTLPFPEIALNNASRRFLLVYGISSAFYRILLYGGIVYAINLLLFPAIALPLSAIIIMTSLIKPVAGEIFVWLKLSRLKNGWRGSLRPIVICIALLSLLFVPWQSSVQVPALLRAGNSYDIYAPEPAKLLTLHVKEGDQVAAGDRLATLHSRALDLELAKTRAQASALDRRINRRLTEVQYHRDVSTSLKELARLHSAVAGLEARRRQLTIRAPQAGRIAMLDKTLRSGLWLANNRPLMTLVGQAGKARIYGYVEERDMDYIAEGARARLWFDGEPWVALTGVVETVYPQAIKTLRAPLMAAVSGGAIAVRPTGDALVPELAIYKTAIRLDADAAARMPMIETRGYALIETPPRNLIDRIIDRVVGLWRRELG